LTLKSDQQGATDSVSLAQYHLLVRLGRATGDSLAVTEGWLYIGFFHYMSDNILISTLAYQNAQKSMVSLPKDHYLNTRLSNLLGINYLALGSYTLAKSQLKLALALNEKNGSVLDKADILENLRYCYLKLEQKDSAKYYAKLALESYSQLLKQNPESSYFLLGAGKELIELENYSEAITFISRALDVCKQSGNTSGIRSCYQYLGTAYYELKDYIKAKEQLLKSLEFKGTQGYEVHQTLSNIYFKEGNYFEAYSHLNDYDSERDKFGTKIREQVYNMEKLFQNLEKERDLLKAQNEASATKNYITVLVSLLFITVFILLFLWILLKQRAKNYKKLEEKTRQIEEVKTQIENKKNLLEKYQVELIKLSKNETLLKQGQQYLFKQVCKTAAITLNVNRVSIWLLNDQSSSMMRKYLFEADNSTDELLTLERKDYPAYFQAIESKPFIIASDAQEHEDTREFTEGYLKPLDIYSLLDCPLVLDRKPIGDICCENKHSKKLWNTEDALFIQLLADFIEKSFRNSRIKNLLAEVEQKNFELISKNNEIETMNEELVSMNESLEETVRHRTSELERQNAQLTEYAFINSHLLRAPLARILGLSQLIAKNIHAPDETRLISSLLESSNELDSIIRKISDVLYEGNNMTREEIKSIIDRNLNRVS
jgi:GAF domain-containing protein/Flp pilus assembly protein TadD